MSDAFRKTVPNQITVLRLILAAGFFASLNVYRYPDTGVKLAWLAIVLFIFAAITDALDGYLARRWEAVSVFGRIMDPFCDKVLVIGAFIYLAGPRFVVPDWIEQGRFITMATGVYPWMIVVILARELLVTGIRGVVESTGASFAAKWSGKWKMILQSITIPVVIALTITFDPATHAWSFWINMVLVHTTVIVTVWSGLPYIFGARHMLGSPSSEGFSQ